MEKNRVLDHSITRTAYLMSHEPNISLRNTPVGGPHFGDIVYMRPNNTPLFT